MWAVVVILCLANGCAAPIPAFSDLRTFDRMQTQTDGSRYVAGCQSIADAYNRMKHIPQTAVCRHLSN